MKITMQKITFPTILTIIRLVVGFFIVPVLVVAVCPYNHWYGNIFVSLFFLAVSFTDFLDGYVARLYNQESYLGKVLDPLADKCLMFATWIALLVIGKLWYGWVLVLMGRELLITTVRLLAVEQKIVISVSQSAKWKTAIHVLCCALIIVNPYQDLGFVSAWNWAETIFLFLSLFFSLYSGWHYCLLFFNQL
ncbi:CDP-diacylglycerol--glycerol-3-phosphate 3-phosphatidyltransferase [bacterium]|nr:CDP-diacylglycerol--glycerol-3-phosphate 3-phosphatidyltransferase [bacterium]